MAGRVVGLDFGGAAGDRPGGLGQAGGPGGGVGGELPLRVGAVEAEHGGGELGGVVAGVVDERVQGHDHQFAARRSAATLGERLGRCGQAGQPGAALGVGVVLAVPLGALDDDR